MKIFSYITLSFALLFLASCQDVINVNLNTAAPRLVIDAAINWQKGTDGSVQKIILSTTTDFYSTITPKVSGATVFIKNSENMNYIFSEIPNTGEYQCTTFKPIIGETYILTVVYKAETYTATETMQSVSPIDAIQQKNNGGFTGKDYEIEVSFKDPPAKNFYMAKFFPEIFKVPSYGIISDEYTNGNAKSWTYSDSDLKEGNKIDITHYGISQAYYNYMNKLISIASSSGGGSPFQTPPATVRGNIVNKTHNDNYALGYFSLNEVDSRNYIIQ